MNTKSWSVPIYSKNRTWKYHEETLYIRLTFKSCGSKCSCLINGETIPVHYSCCCWWYYRADASWVTLVTCYTPNYKNIFEMCVLFSTWICRYITIMCIYIDLYVWCYKTYFQACITMTTNSIQSFVTAQQSVCISLNFPCPLFPILVVVINANAWIDKCIWFWLAFYNIKRYLSEKKKVKRERKFH